MNKKRDLWSRFFIKRYILNLYMETKSTPQDIDTSFVDLAEGTLGKEPQAPQNVELKTETPATLDAKYAAPVKVEPSPKDIARTEEILKDITNKAEQVIAAPEKPAVETISTPANDLEMAKKDSMQNIKDAESFLGQNINGMSSEQLKDAIDNEEAYKNDSAKNGMTVSAGVAAAGVLSGVMAPAVIGLTPGLAASLPAFMTSVVSIGGVGIASSAVVLGGIGLAALPIGYGIYKLRNFFTKRNAEKARKAVQDKELDELF